MGGANTGPFTLAVDTSVAWQWATNYWLETGTTGEGTVDVAAGWYDRGTNVTITATAAEHHHVTRWTGDTNRCTFVGTQIIVPMDQPRAVIAVFRINCGTLMIIH